MERIVLTWGLIPNDNSSEMIYCGDEETSETTELNFEIIDSEAGVFMNDNKQHNGKVYLRYYFEEDEEIYDEKVCVATIN